MVEHAPRDPVLGIDFSGAQDAGRHIWVAEASPDDDGWYLTGLKPAEDLRYGGRERGDALYGLHMLLRMRPQAAVGIDVPFGLPRKIVNEPDWTSFLEGFARSHGSADAFREACRERDGGSELRRVTDDEAGTPWSPYNHRLYRQTYHALKNLVHPLVKGDVVRVLPMQEPHPDKPWLLEVCPASTLADAGLDAPYKGRGREEREARERILDEVPELVGLEVPAAARKDALQGTRGDAVDAVVALVATLRAVEGGELEVAAPGTPYALEGRVHV